MGHPVVARGLATHYLAIVWFGSRWLEKPAHVLAPLRLGQALVSVLIPGSHEVHGAGVAAFKHVLHHAAALALRVMDDVRNGRRVAVCYVCAYSRAFVYFPLAV